jgi:hypothetical protein
MVISACVCTLECGFTLFYPSYMTVTIKTGVEIEGMRIAGRLASEVLDYITPFVKPGVTTG